MNHEKQYTTYRHTYTYSHTHFEVSSRESSRLLALEVLYAAEALELSIHHDGQSGTQCLTLLHTERERMIHTPVERERESAHL